MQDHDLGHGLSLAVLDDDIRNADDAGALSRVHLEMLREARLGFVSARVSALSRRQSQHPLQLSLSAALAFWIAHPSPAPPIPLYLTLTRTPSGWFVSEATIHSPTLRHPDDKPPAVFPDSAVKDALAIYIDLVSSMGSTDQTRIAIRTLATALREGAWPVRFATLWIIMECLYGDARTRGGIAQTIAQRAGFFLAANRRQARKLVKQVRESYSARSKIVHGLHPKSMTPMQGEGVALGLTRGLERLVRQSLFKIFREPGMLERFNDSDQRTQYLDKMLYTLP